MNLLRGNSTSKADGPGNRGNKMSRNICWQHDFKTWDRRCKNCDVDKRDYEMERRGDTIHISYRRFPSPEETPVVMWTFETRREGTIF